MIQFSYDHYVKWEANGGKELLLGANRLTTRQLFWIALARTIYVKSKSDEKKTSYDKTVSRFKNSPLDLNESFLKDFNCPAKPMAPKQSTTRSPAKPHLFSQLFG